MPCLNMPGVGRAMRDWRRPTKLWTPAQLGAKLTNRWSADGLSDGAVTTWTDSIAGLAPTQGTAGARPTKAATSFNGFPGVTFDGTDDYLRIDAVTGLPTGSSTSEVWAAVIQSADAVADSSTQRIAFIYGGASSGTRDFRRNPVGTPANRFRMTAEATNHGDAYLDFIGSHVTGARYEATQMFGRIDGRANSGIPTAITLNTSTTRTTIGAGNANTAANFWNGVVRHIMVTSSLTIQERQQLEAWLAWDGGIPNVLPSDHPFKNGSP